MCFKLLFQHVVVSIFFVLMVTPADARDMRIVYAQGYEPLSWKDEEGKAKGIEIDFLEAILSRRMGLSIQHETYPWARSQMMVKKGDRDAFLTIPNAERRTYTEITKLPLFSTNYTLFTGASNPKKEALRAIRSLEELKSMEGLRHIMITGGGWHTTHLGEVKSMQQVTNSTQVLKMLAMNRADVYVEQAALVNYQIKILRLRGQILEIPTVMTKVDWHLCIGKKSPFVELLPQLDKVLENMRKEGALEKLQTEIFSQYQ